MYEGLSEILASLSGNPVLWAVAVIAAMAVTAVALYGFWDLVGRGAALATRAWNARRRG